jgi:hypothetical protein
VVPRCPVDRTTPGMAAQGAILSLPFLDIS